MRLETAKGIYKDKATKSDIMEIFQDDEGRGDLINLSLGSEDYIQATGEGDGPYRVEYREGDEEHHFQCSQELSKSEVESIFLKYFAGDESWRRAVRWTQLGGGWAELGMGEEQDRCSGVPFACSIVPIILAVGVGLAGLIYPEAPRDSTSGCSPLVFSKQFVGFFLVFLVTGPLGLISIFSGKSALKKPAAKGRALVEVAIGLGVLEVTVVIAVVGYVLLALMR
ncbi:MAG: hypothetical protein ACYS8Z_03715 [Planctomycetota bacterium]